MEPDNDKSHFEQTMLQYQEEEEAERLAIMEEGNTLTLSEPEPLNIDDVTQEDVDQFLIQLEEAKKILQTKGHHVGLCEMCLDTGTLTMENEEGYTGLQYKVDNEIPILLRCTHGATRTYSFDF